MTESEKMMLVAAMRWARANGWRRVGNWDVIYWSKRGHYRLWVDTYDGVHHVRVDDKVANQGLTDFWPRSITEAVSVLVAFGILPGVTLLNIKRGRADVS